jgi:hypothetical protein
MQQVQEGVTCRARRPAILPTPSEQIFKLSCQAVSARPLTHLPEKDAQGVRDIKGSNNVSSHKKVFTDSLR